VREPVLRFLLKILWSVGGHADAVDGLPRLTGASVEPALPRFRPGDFVLLGNNGRLTHVAVHVGAGELVHAMATEKTMRGWWGSLVDALRRGFGARESDVGVVREPLARFLERYERDTWVAVRCPDLPEEARDRGLERVLSLVGRPYDYGFRAGNEGLYCTELVDEFLRAALGERAPELERTRHRVPLLLDEQVIEPVAVLKHPALGAVAANAAARANYAAWLEMAEILEEGLPPTVPR
jgi:hypothetical protein